MIHIVSFYQYSMLTIGAHATVFTSLVVVTATQGTILCQQNIHMILEYSF